MGLPLARAAPPPLRLALVGCGDIARFVGLFAHLNRHVQPVACCDIRAGRAASFAHHYRIGKMFTDYAKLLEWGEMDAVYLAVPHDLHREMILAALVAGFPVWSEKPLTRTLAEGQEVVRVAQERQLPLGVNYQYRYDTGCYGLARAVQAGHLGEVYSVTCSLVWRRDGGYFRNAPWHASLAQAGGGTLLTQGSHLLDVALWALGSPPVAASGATGQRKFRESAVEDVAVGHVELANGALVQVHSTMAAAASEPLRLDVYGSRGSAHYSNRPWPHVRFRGLRVRCERPPHRGRHALQRSLEGFRAWLVEGVHYLTPADEALPVLAAVEAIYQSAQSGNRVPIPAAEAGSPIPNPRRPHG